MLTAAIFFCEIPKYVQAYNILSSPLSGWLTWIACLPSWLGMVNAGRQGPMQSEIFLQMKCIIFLGCPIEQAAFVPRQPVPYNQILIQLVPQCYA